MSAIPRCVSLTALLALLGVAVAGEAKGPVHITSRGITDFDGDTARFQAAMAADERGETELASGPHLGTLASIRTLHDEAHRAMSEARVQLVVVHAVATAEMDEAREAAREIAEEAREQARDAIEAAREAAREARETVFEAKIEARSQIAEAMAEAKAAMAAARREIAERTDESTERSVTIEEGRWKDAVEIRNGKVVRCNDPSKYPGTGCTPFTPEEKAKLEAEARAAQQAAEDAMAEADAAIRDAERALQEETGP